jgi:dolichol-phosphate mannosyltransferase
VTPSISIVVPAYNEGASITRCLDRITSSVSEPCEVLVVYDTETDTTAPFAQEYADKDPRVRPTLNTYGRGPANALRFGLDHATAPVVVVTMADGSDDPRMIEPLAALVERGAVVAAASRYMAGGQQIGGPRLKGLFSRLAGLTLYHLARCGTHDATNSFKAYSRDFLQQVGVDSRAGFEIGLELTAKARRLRRPVAELPTIWLDRTEGESNFQIRKWLPHYLYWYRFAYGPRLTVDQIRTRSTPPG